MNGARLLNDTKPSDLRRHQMQYYGISDSDFGKEYLLNFEEKSNQVIALYALSGKFQIYYVLDKFEVEKINDDEVSIFSTQIKAYVDDSFDFVDSPMQFVGAWNYDKMEFMVEESILQGYVKDDIVYIANKLPLVEVDKNISKDSDNNIMRNQDYQNIQFFFNLGLDFIVTSKSFKNLKIPNDYLSKRVYTRYFKLLDLKQ
ncbi:DUF6402 family protein [Helicobacter sp. T3_23-1059]